MPETRRSNVIVITGTDSGAGKTWVAAALARALGALGARVVAIKAVDIGCRDDRRETEDGVVLAKATGQKAPTEALLRFREFLTPVLAAEHEGRTIDFDELLMKVEDAGADADVVLLEGNGGLLTPITWDWCIVDVAQALEARMLVVGSDRMGIVNQALLTLGTIELASVPVTHLVLTPPQAPDLSTGSNAAAIARLAGFPRIHEVPRTDDPATAAASLREVAASLYPVAPAPGLG
ncbi:MAG TPA: dethiobiotin synthase [Gemmatimonadales bacterium]|nr:dethiobiotin synthase [Gemmatimonadales bacterium]